MKKEFAFRNFKNVVRVCWIPLRGLNNIEEKEKIAAELQKEADNLKSKNMLLYFEVYPSTRFIKLEAPYIAVHYDSLDTKKALRFIEKFFIKKGFKKVPLNRKKD